MSDLRMLLGLDPITPKFPGKIGQLYISDGKLQIVTTKGRTYVFNEQSGKWIILKKPRAPRSFAVAK